MIPDGRSNIQERMVHKKLLNMRVSIKMDWIKIEITFMWG